MESVSVFKLQDTRNQEVRTHSGSAIRVTGEYNQTPLKAWQIPPPTRVAPASPHLQGLLKVPT